MTVLDQSRNINVLLDRYLEVCNHYSAQLRRLENDKDSPSRLTRLIEKIEKFEPGAIRVPLDVIRPTDALGQNIVPTQDTLDALEAYRDDILLRLSSRASGVPRNIQLLTRLLKQDVKQIASAFPSFTYAWDKLVELSRFSVVPDERQLQTRDIVCMATIEFEQFCMELLKVVSPYAPISTPVVANLIDAFQHNQWTSLDNLFAVRIQDANRLLPLRGSHIKSSEDTLAQIVSLARRNIDLLAILGLQIGFVHWIEMDGSPSHRKLVIKSLIYYSKILLAEASWNRAVEFTRFAIELQRETNRRANLDSEEGLAMLLCNQYWARKKLNEDIAFEVDVWDTTNLHERYSFLKFVLSGRNKDAVRMLDSLLGRSPQTAKSAPNISIQELEEWPILEEFRTSKEYISWRNSAFPSTI